MLKDAEESKIAEMQRVADEREQRKREKTELKREAIEQAAALAEEYKEMGTAEGKRKWYFKELRKVVEASDVILQVLDARDPIGCRAKDVENLILTQQSETGAPNKRLVFILNKIDLVPSNVVQDWVKYLRREFPTIAFKSSTQKGRGFLGSIDVKASKASNKILDTKSAVGAGALLQLLKNYSRSLDVKTGLTVGVIGYPNVGKSSIINSLKSQRAVQTSPNAGCTKVLQQVRLDGNIMLVDSPGVLFSADDDDNHAGLLLRNALRVDQVTDPITAIGGILERCTPQQLQAIYEIGDYTTTQEFLMFVAHRRGKIGKGGVPIMDEAARCVLQDWNSGKIPFHTLPPVVDNGLTTIVSQAAEAFDINALLDSANAQTVRVIHENNFHQASTTSAMGEDSDMGEEEEEEESIMTTTSGFLPVEESGSEDEMMDDDDEVDDEELEMMMAQSKKSKPAGKGAYVKSRMGRSKASSVLSNNDYNKPATNNFKALQKMMKKKAKRNVSFDQ